MAKTAKKAAKPDKPHRVEIRLAFTTRKDFLIFKGTIAHALSKSLGSFSTQPALRQIMDAVENQAAKQKWEDLYRDKLP